MESLTGKVCGLAVLIHNDAYTQGVNSSKDVGLGVLGC